jgi:uncharacterized protein (DUF58 family)
MKIRAVLIIVPLVILALALAWGSILMLRLFSLSVLVLLLSYLWTLLGIRGIEAQVKQLPERCQVGEEIDEEITVFNRSKVPKLLIEAQENTDLPGHYNMLAFNLSPGSSRSWRARVYCQRRGRYHLGSFTATVTDPFGFFSLNRNLGEAQQVLVYPATLELPTFWPLSHHEAGYSPNHWLINESTPNASRVREYTTSDSLNRIHWNSTAHIGKLMVKVFDADRPNNVARNLWVVADMHQASHLGDNDETTEEYCVTLAASLIKKYIDNGRQVGLAALGDQPYFFPPQTGDQHLWRMLEALALMKATGDVPIDRLISDEIERFGLNSAIVVITSSADERVAASLRRLTDRGIRAVAILLDPVSFGGTVSAANVARRLTSSGIQNYIVRQGSDLAAELNNRASSSYIRHIGDMV